ncbi:DsbA family oxidoreductase [Sandaracinobacteroides hominis]|uniref:DsbA family oxidoreductase n=1 Tax=Sandaracinobacteroides hominis TaxID=2780086 RepID=UPI0018F716F6|nr:DsbA family oxidoreductase [Sandaracinobacteroides hominis]
MAIKVDIISDVVCPWCLIGYRQLEKALEIAGLQADIRWHPFELNPQMAPEGEDVAEHIARKYGATREQSATSRSHMDSIARPLGIAFDRSPDKRIYNSFDAHQLLHWAKDTEKQTALKLALFDAYFSRSEDISDREILLAAVEKAGLNRAEAEEILNDQRYAPAVRALEQRWQEMGITGVPAMILAEKGLIMGAQEPERLAIALQKMAAQAA